MVPDREQGRFTTVKVNQAVADGALVLIAGHDEKEHNAGRKTQQQDHSSEGKPVYLPGEDE